MHDGGGGGGGGLASKFVCVCQRQAVELLVVVSCCCRCCFWRIFRGTAAKQKEHQPATTSRQAGRQGGREAREFVSRPMPNGAK